MNKHSVNEQRGECSRQEEKYEQRFKDGDSMLQDRKETSFG